MASEKRHQVQARLLRVRPRAAVFVRVWSGRAAEEVHAEEVTEEVQEIVCGNGMLL
jgi:hypothetical protein